MVWDWSTFQRLFVLQADSCLEFFASLTYFISYSSPEVCHILLALQQGSLNAIV